MGLSLSPCFVIHSTHVICSHINNCAAQSSAKKPSSSKIPEVYIFQASFLFCSWLWDRRDGKEEGGYSYAEHLESEKK